MRVLVIGSGGREHALCWALKKSKGVSSLYCAPGNYGISQIAELVPIKVDQIRSLANWAKENAIDFVVVGPELPLVLGLADRLSEYGIPVFGPSAAAAQLEGSKGFVKDLCRDNNIPTAAYERCNSLSEAQVAIQKMPGKIVVKADGLAAGKGVIICDSREEAIEAAQQLFADATIAAKQLVIEEFLEGEEASFFALVNGSDVLPLTAAQDHKRAYDGDKGPNTGGMGAYSPAPVVTDALADEIVKRIIQPTADAMVKRGMPFVGVLFAGLMITKDGPSLIEYNVRFGDPECQVLLPRLENDLLDLLLSTAKGELKEKRISWLPKTTVGVVMAAKGYPGAYEKNTEIKGLDDAARSPFVTIFHAATKTQDAKILADGGRVLTVVGEGKTASEAQRRAYEAIEELNWPGGFCRKDIAYRAIAREKKAA